MASNSSKTTPVNKYAPQREVSTQGRRRRRAALLLLTLLLMFGSYLLGRDSSQPATAPVDFETPTLPPAASTTPPAPKPVAPAVVTTPPPVTTPAVPAAASITVTASAATETAPVTALLEVTVGTHGNGGLTLKFDHPVSWVVSDNSEGNADVDIQGVHNLDTFPRNLPLPPGVKVIHAGIVDSDTLHLRFSLRHKVRALTTPSEGPSSVLTLFFRTPAQGSSLPTLPQYVQNSGGCGSAASAANTRAIALLQKSLDRNATYADVRTALTLLESCTGDGSKAERLLSQTLKTGGNDGMRIVAADAALRFARGDTGGAIQLLKSNQAGANGDPGYAELLADLQAAGR